MADIDPAEPDHVSDEPEQEHADGSEGERTAAVRRRISPIAKWASGIAAGVLTPTIVAWLVVWGVVPQSSGAPEVVESPEASEPSLGTGDEEPLTVAVTRAQDRCNGNGWVIPAVLDENDFDSFGGDADNWDDWADAAGGIPANFGALRFTIQGRSEAQVVLTDLTVRVMQRMSPVTGTHVYDGCGGPGAYRWVHVDLDTDPPTYSANLFEEQEELVEPHERRPIRFPYEVSLTDAESFEVVPSTAACDCLWTVELAWASEGRTGVLTIDDDGEPFRLTSSSSTSVTCVRQPSFGPFVCS